MGRVLAILLALILAPTVSMASVAVKCGDGVIRKSCCCKKQEPAEDPCPGPRLKGKGCCERVVFATSNLNGRDSLRSSLEAPLSAEAQGYEPILQLRGVLQSPHVLRSFRPPTGPPVYLSLRMLLI